MNERYSGYPRGTGHWYLDGKIMDIKILMYHENYGPYDGPAFTLENRIGTQLTIHTKYFDTFKGGFKWLIGHCYRTFWDKPPGEDGKIHKFKYLGKKT